MRKVTNNKHISSKRIQDIENYEYSLWNLVNPNTRNQLILNPIGGRIALITLQKLRKELDSYEISLEEIKCTRVFDENADLTETEVFIKSTNSYLGYIADYNKFIQIKELDRGFPREQREKIVNELKEKIEKEYKKIETIGKINNNIKKVSEAKVTELNAELRDILSTLESPTEEYLNNILYRIADSKIKEIKRRLDSKINYLSSVMEMKVV